MKKTIKPTLRNADYEQLFLKPADIIARNGKPVYISPKFHELLSRIVLISGSGKMGLSDYLHNVLEHHFQDFGAEIKDVYNSKNTPIF